MLRYAQHDTVSNVPEPVMPSEVEASHTQEAHV